MNLRNAGLSLLNFPVVPLQELIRSSLLKLIYFMYVSWNMVILRKPLTAFLAPWVVYLFHFFQFTIIFKYLKYFFLFLLDVIFLIFFI